MKRIDGRELLSEMIDSAREELVRLETTNQYIEQKMEFQKQFIEKLESQLASMRGKPVSARKRIEARQTERQVRPHLNGRASRKVTGGSMAEKVAEVLREKGAPMRGGDISAVLEQAGVTTTAKRGVISMVFSELKRRKDLFEKVDRGVYRLKEAA